MFPLWGAFWFLMVTSVLKINKKTTHSSPKWLISDLGYPPYRSLLSPSLNLQHSTVLLRYQNVTKEPLHWGAELPTAEAVALRGLGVVSC